MRIPTRIPVNGATSPAASPRVLAPVQTLPGRPQNGKNKKVFFPNDPNFRSDKYQANLNLAPRNWKTEKIKKNSRNEVNPTQDKYGANPTLPRFVTACGTIDPEYR
jgi:hypothetical protein